MNFPIKLSWADLHCHTQASDGSLTPIELIKMAKESGLHGISITDHDTTIAYRPETIATAKQLGLCLGAGIELSCVFEGHDVHVLGYDFQLSSHEIGSLCKRHHQRRRDRNQQMVAKLKAEGIDISMQELETKGKTIGRPHMAQLMVQKRCVSSIREAFNRYLGEGKLCYVQGKGLSVDETIDTIHKAEGKAFLAHPHLFPSSFPIDELLEKPFDGIECWYANLSKKSAEPWIEIAQKKKWLMSGGSDFHGAIKPNISLGSQGVSEATFYQIFKHPLV